MASSADIAAPMPPEVCSPEDVRHLSGPIDDQHGFLTSADETRLFYRYWPADKTNARDERVMIVLHGIGYHSGPYKVIADALNPQGVGVYGLDARGHGLSHGRRGFVGTSAQVAADVAAMVQLVKDQRPAAKVFLLGDSMGADFALNYVKDHSEQLSGLILMALALNLHSSQFLSADSLRLMPYFFFGHRKPVLDLVGKRLDESSRDAKFIAARRSDPLAYKNVSFGYLLDVQRLVFGWRWTIAPRVKTPTLLIKGGKDRVVSHGECVAFDRRSASADKQFRIFPDVPHTTLWDPQTPEILGLVGEWILKR
jgi:alpha-beta hydrolase superfamily lysophospholipase